MNHREYLIEDHTWAYNHNKEAINKYWKERHTFICSFTGKNMVRSFIKAARYHKAMIEQLKVLPDIAHLNNDWLSFCWLSSSVGRADPPLGKGP